jgi:hypothetical protein
LEECQLLQSSGQTWTPDLCKTCPVPGISRANACEFLQLRAQVGRPLNSAFQKRVQINAYCKKTGQSVKEPHIGCGECHPLPPSFSVKP